MRKALEQKVADAVANRDATIGSFREETHRSFLLPDQVYIDFAYRLVSVQSVVDSAKKELYTWLRKNGEAIEHKEL